MPATVGSQIKGPCSRIDLHEAVCRHRRAGDVSRGLAAQGRRLDVRYLPEGGRSLPQGRPSVRHRRSARRPTTSTPRARSSTASAPCWSMRRATSRSRRDAVRQALDYYKKLMAFLPPDVPAWDDASNNKFLVSGQASMIMNPPSRLGGRQARRAEGRRAALDARLRAGPEGPLRAVRAVLLEHLELQQEPVGGQEPARASVAAPTSSRSMVVAIGGYDLPSFEKFTTFKVWQEEGPPKGTLYPLSQPVQPPDPVGRRCAGAARDRRAHLHPGDADPDGGALLQGRADREDAGLGGKRARRLHAQLTDQANPRHRNGGRWPTSPARPATAAPCAIR